MCTVAAGIALSAASTLWGGLQQQRAASAQAAAVQAQAEDQAALLRYNAEQAQQDAANVRTQETEQIEELYERRRALQGAQAAAFGASGSLLTSGDFSNINYGTFETTERDIAALRANYNTQAIRYLNEAGVSEWQATNVLTGAANQANVIRTNARSSLLGSALSAGSLLASNWDSLFGPRRTV